MDNSPSSSRPDRKLVERDRRNRMKTLYAKLNSLVPHSNSREATSLPDQLDEAAKYIKRLQINLERTRERKARLMGNSSSSSRNDTFRPAEIKIEEMGSAMEVVLKTGLDGHFLFIDTIRILLEEGADVANASFTVVDDSVFHTIHSTVGEGAPGFGAAKIIERLNKVVHDA